MNNLSRYRIARGWSQENLAEKLDVTPGAVAMWESGKRTPRIRKASEIASIFGVTIEDIFVNPWQQKDSEHLNVSAEKGA